MFSILINNNMCGSLTCATSVKAIISQQILNSKNENISYFDNNLHTINNNYVIFRIC